MAVSYKKLFHLLIEEEMSNADLQKQAGFSANIITRLKKNEYVKLQTIESICKVLNCRVDDILEFVANEDIK
ncbi:helix-turn-helix domain-containing protein [Clostridium sporogenes]|jgi:putative transcriptional regulator|uniref:helix-turn-helix domain-containing protein n=1 Tax=Clostridium sporogenes TaxID=1509 RepID=UPI0006B29EDC|nr:helix-turn-helix transcriptional regulator [Clostridium sporogenes]KOY65948.1 transcriptional regulator [Clostridium sporogenes]